MSRAPVPRFPQPGHSSQQWAEDSATLIFGDELVEDFVPAHTSPTHASPVRVAPASVPPPPMNAPARPISGAAPPGRAMSAPEQVRAPSAAWGQPPGQASAPDAPWGQPQAQWSAPPIHNAPGFSPTPAPAAYRSSPAHTHSGPTNKRASSLRGFVWGASLATTLFVGAVFLYQGGPDGEEKGRSPPVVLDGDAIKPVKPAPLLDRARHGEDKALLELETKEASSRSPDEVKALFEGKEARAREKTKQVIGEIAKKRSFSVQDQAEFFRHAGNQGTYREAIMAMAQNESEWGPDMIYQAMRKFRHQDYISEFALSVLVTPEVYKHASAPLTVVIDAETVTECREVRQLVDRAREDGDARAVRHMAKFAETTGCGDLGYDDCYPCLRKNRALVDALRAAQDRGAPY